MGPGFIFVKVVYLFGEQHKRLDWEWLVWSVLASLPIAGATDVLLSPKLQGPLPFEFVQGTTRFALVLVAGSAVAYLWRTHRHNQHPLVRFVRHSLADSAWDVVLDNALRDGCGVAVTVERPNDAGVTTEASYYGRLATFGYETAGAEPIVFLKGVSKWDSAEGKYVPLAGDKRDGLLFHRDEIKRMRIWAPKH